MLAVSKIILLLILAAVLAGCAHMSSTPSLISEHTPKSAQDELESNQYAVYDAVINKMYLADGVDLVVIENPTRLGISQEQEWDKELEYAGKIMPERLPALSAETFSDFRAKNRTSSSLKQLFNNKVKCVLVSKTEFDEVFKPKNNGLDGWITFSDRYPKSHGMLYLSNVGFNREMNQALVLAGNQWGLESGCRVLCNAPKGKWQLEY